jgi:hypothetical protein
MEELCDGTVCLSCCKVVAAPRDLLYAAAMELYIKINLVFLKGSQENIN